MYDSKLKSDEPSFSSYFCSTTETLLFELLMYMYVSIFFESLENPFVNLLKCNDEKLKLKFCWRFSIKTAASSYVDLNSFRLRKNIVNTSS